MDKETRNKLREEYKLIADFLGWRYIPVNFDSDTKLCTGWHKPILMRGGAPPTLYVGEKNPGFVVRKTLDLNFRYDWRMLMEIVLFIESIEDKKHGGFRVIIDSDCCTISSKLKSKETSYSTTFCSKGGKKKAIYESILLFINFYKT